MLKRVHLRKIDGVETCLGHGRHHEEKRVDVADAPRWRRGAPEYNARKQTYSDEVGIVESDEVEGREVGGDVAKSTREGGRHADAWV